MAGIAKTCYQHLFPATAEYSSSDGNNSSTSSQLTNRAYRPQPSGPYERVRPRQTKTILVYDNLIHDFQDFSETAVVEQCCCSSCTSANTTDTDKTEFTFTYANQQQQTRPARSTIIPNGINAIDRLLTLNEASKMSATATNNNLNIINSFNAGKQSIRFSDKCCDQLVPLDSLTEFKLRSAAVQLTQLVQRPSHENAVLSRSEQHRRDFNRIRAIVDIYLRLINLCAIKLPPATVSLASGRNNDRHSSTAASATTSDRSNNDYGNRNQLFGLQCDTNCQPNQHSDRNAPNTVHRIQSSSQSCDGHNDSRSTPSGRPAHLNSPAYHCHNIPSLQTARGWVLDYIENLNGYCDSIGQLRSKLKWIKMIAVIDAYDGVLLELVKQHDQHRCICTDSSGNSNQRFLYYESAV